MKLSGELAYRIGYDVEHDLFHAQNVFNDEYIKPTFIEYVQKLEKKNAELEAQNGKMMCLNEEITKALKESLDYEWLPAHNGKAKYLYLQTAIDIVNEKFEEIKENE